MFVPLAKDLLKKTVDVNTTVTQLLPALCTRMGYAFADINGGVDFYVRGSKSSFPHRYAHYKLGVDDPVHFWRAESYKFVNRVVWPFWMYHRWVRR